MPSRIEHEILLYAAYCSYHETRHSPSTTVAEIDCAANKWAADTTPFRIAKHRQGSPVFFRKIASQWFDFLGQLPDHPRSPFDIR